MSASWTASSAASKSPDWRGSVPRTCGARSRSRASSGWLIAGVTDRLKPRSRLVGAAGRLEERLHVRRRTGCELHDLAHRDRLLDGDATRPRHGRVLCGDLERPRFGVDVDDLVAGDPLLELLERDVGEDGSGNADEVDRLR